MKTGVFAPLLLLSLVNCCQRSQTPSGTLGDAALGTSADSSTASGKTRSSGPKAAESLVDAAGTAGDGSTAAKVLSASGGEWTASIVDSKSQVTRGIPLLNAVRSAQHDGFERVTFEFTGEELPAYHIEYIDKPVRRCGSGDVTAIAGDGWLEVRFEPAHAHTEQGAATIKEREQQLAFKIIRELELTCDFEGQVIWVLGVSHPNKYRVTVLKQPARLAIDVRH